MTAVAELVAPETDRTGGEPPVWTFPPDDSRVRRAPEPVSARPSAVWVAVLLLIAAEAMLFSGLIVAFVFYRLQSPIWPPLGEPRLPIALTAANTVVLLLSGATMRRTLGLARAGRRRECHRTLLTTALLGAAFLAIQGSEWARLLHWGLTAGSSPYGGIFYVLVGAHGVHVLAAVVVLLALAAIGRGRPVASTRLEAGSLYWYFVCAVWAVLFPLIYL